MNSTIGSTISQLAEAWKNSGIVEGDLILLHSNVKRTLLKYRALGIKLSPNDILESFLIAVGESGTLLLPTFSFDFSNGMAFDINKTKSEMGVITEIARCLPGAIRTGHPVYSFVALGKLSSEFSTIDNFSAYGDNSPFGLLRKLNGRIAVLDLEDQESMTFYHHVEELKFVDYRFFKNFTGKYSDKFGVNHLKTYCIFVRDIERGVVTDVNSAGELMWKDGLYIGDRPKLNSGLRIINANDIFAYTSWLIDSGRAYGNLYRTI